MSTENGLHIAGPSWTPRDGNVDAVEVHMRRDK